MLVAYTVALDLVRSLRSVVVELRKYSADAADQVERAASSVVLNIAEGGRRRGRDPQRFFSMANGSAGEILGALDLADAWGWKIESARARELLDREQRLLHGLTRRTGANCVSAKSRTSALGASLPGELAMCNDDQSR
jgi:four helix bundle protein